MSKHRPAHTPTSTLQWLSAGVTRATHYEQAEMGKTEISLMHFSVSPTPHGYV